MDNHISLLREYVRLIFEESIKEDVSMKRLNPGMLGIYSLAQAINKLIYEGKALSGALPIDIISAGKDLKSAPMVTDTESSAGISLQHTGATFKLYIDPSKSKTFTHAGNETHDIIHTITGHIAKAIARRRESIEDSGEYAGTPSRFNKITLKDDEIADFTARFKKAFGFELPYSAFEKAFKIRNASEYGEWFAKTYWPKVKKKTAKIDGKTANRQSFSWIGNAVWRGIYGDGGVVPGIFSHMYWGNVDTTGIRLKPTSTYDFGVPNIADEDSPVKVAWKQSMEDEEMIGNIINAVIQDNVSEGAPISNVERAVEQVFSAYKRAPSPSVRLGNIAPKDYKLRFNTAEAREAITRLFELYNQFLQRYTVSLSAAQPTRKQIAKRADTEYERTQVDDEQRQQIAAAKSKKRAKRKTPRPKKPRR